MEIIAYDAEMVLPSNVRRVVRASREHRDAAPGITAPLPVPRTASRHASGVLQETLLLVPLKIKKSETNKIISVIVFALNNNLQVPKSGCVNIMLLCIIVIKFHVFVCHSQKDNLYIFIRLVSWQAVTKPHVLHVTLVEILMAHAACESLWSGVNIELKLRESSQK